jgi:GT2 family glycosyltransferase
MSSLSVIIPSWNTRELLKSCLRSLQTSLPHSSEVIVVDNGSTDGSARMIMQNFPTVRLVRNARNLGFSVACNQGIALARGGYILLLNSDTLVEGDALRRMELFLECNAYYGACVPRLVNLDGSTQRSMQRLPSLWTPLFTGTPLERWFPESAERRRYQALDFDYERVGEVENPPAVCLMLRRAALGDEKPLDEQLWLAFSDTDLSRRLWYTGWRIAYLPQARVQHFGGASSAQMADYDATWQRNRLEYFRKHHGHVAGLWVKLCMGLAVCDHSLRELWRRAHGDQEECLTRVWAEFATFLRH